ncbi:MAG: ParB/RepB/Spo0J family partition protein [Acetobacteraceae bacterium]|nr:ParB/RepB/Spo0J family partition protein [Acetobacteraceae bacterium]
MSSKELTPRLGRGLAALLGDMADSPSPSATGSRNGVHSLPVESLEPGPFQPRSVLDSESLAELVESVRARGVLQPLLVRPHPTLSGRYQIIAGERRWRASQAAGVHEVPVLVRDLPDAEAMAAALVENLQRRDLDPIEEAEGFRRLIDELGMNQDQLAQAVGKSRSHVANTLRLLHLPSSVQMQVRQGALSAGHARALLTHPEPEKAALSVIARGLNVRQTEALAAARTNPPSHTDPDRPRDPETASIEHELSEKLGLRVRIDRAGKGGRLSIHYANFDQLDGLIALLGRP